MMMRILILALILSLIPIDSAAMPSRQVDNLISLSPTYTYTLADKEEEWPEILKLIEDDSTDYTMLEAIRINLDTPCEWLYVKLTRPLMVEDEPFVIIVDECREITKQEIGFDEDGRACIDLINYEIGKYWICFYVLNAK